MLPLDFTDLTQDVHNGVKSLEAHAFVQNISESRPKVFTWLLAHCPAITDYNSLAVQSMVSMFPSSSNLLYQGFHGDYLCYVSSAWSSFLRRSRSAFVHRFKGAGCWRVEFMFIVQQLPDEWMCETPYTSPYNILLFIRMCVATVYQVWAPGRNMLVKGLCTAFAKYLAPS